MKRGKRHPTHAERGAAMLAAVFMMGVFSILGAAYWRQLHASLSHTRDLTKGQLSRELAEAGIARAVAELRVGNADFSGVEKVPLGDGVYSVQVAPEGDAQRLVTAVGALSDGDLLRRAVQIRTRVQLDGAGIPSGVEYLLEAQ